MLSEFQAFPSPNSPNEKGRKLTPKERGCFQCSRRRIICDKKEPSCGKCIKKGIECSGVNRIRFTGSVARRGKFKDLKIPEVQGDEAHNLPDTTSFTGVRWSNDRKPRVKRKKRGTDVEKEAGSPRSGLASEVHKDGAHSPCHTIDEQASEHDDYGNSTPHPLVTGSEAQELDDDDDDDDDDVEDIIRIDDENQIIRRHSATMTVQPWIAPLTAEARMLFSYFSEAVAPVMVVLDTVSNGYRELILPMAFEDEVLRRAVGVVAAQHLAREKPEMIEAAEAGRRAIISRLRNDSLSATPDQVFNISTWATLIVLLVGETVTGSADFGFLVNMLLCLSSGSRFEDEDSAVKKFLRVQTNMFEALSVPLMGERNGVTMVQGAFKMWQNWLTTDNFPLGSENYRIVDRIRLCFASASDIYLRRATSDNTESTSPPTPHYDEIQTSAIQQLIEHVSQIPPNTPGGHALVWPCFVAGAEATDPSQRVFLVERMHKIYACTKFRNIPAAVESLERLWANKGKRWTQCLPEISNVLVM